jgi:threonine/homoserine/homoserine lactone efflux protein
MLTENFLSFLLIAFLIELTPGPNMVWLALTGATVGRQAAFAATAGIAVGLAIVALGAAFGVAGLAQASPTLLAWMRYAGVAYLFWLAWQAWTGRGEISPGHIRNGDVGTWFRHGLLLNLLNPKAALFFVAILPGHVDSAHAVMPQTLLLSASYVAIATFVHLLLSLLAGRAHHWLERGKNDVLARRICGLALAAVAIWFLLESGS